MINVDSYILNILLNQIVITFSSVDNLCSIWSSSQLVSKRTYFFHCFQYLKLDSSCCLYLHQRKKTKCNDSVKRIQSYRRSGFEHRSRQILVLKRCSMTKRQATASEIDIKTVGVARERTLTARRPCVPGLVKNQEPFTSNGDVFK